MIYLIIALVMVCLFGYVIIEKIIKNKKEREEEEFKVLVAMRSHEIRMNQPTSSVPQSCCPYPVKTTKPVVKKVKKSTKKSK